MSGLIDTIGRNLGFKEGNVPDVNALSFGQALRQIRGRTPSQFSTGRSSLNARTGEINLDPSIRGIQDESLSMVRGLRGDIGQNRDAFIEARVAPLERQIDRRRSGLTRELGRTGVRGTFRNQALNRFALQSGDELGEARAEATFQADQTALDNARAIASDINQIGVQRYQQELESLGLPADVVNSIMTNAINLSTGQTSTAVRAGGLRDQRDQMVHQNWQDVARGIMSAMG